MNVQSEHRIVLSRYVVTVRCRQADDYTHLPGYVTPVELTIRRNEDKTPWEIAQALMTMPEVVFVKIMDWDKQGVVFTK